MHWLRMAAILLLGLSTCRLTMASDVGNAWVLDRLDRTDWPEALISQASMDTASRGEVLMFAKALLASEALDEEGLSSDSVCPTCS